VPSTLLGHSSRIDTGIDSGDFFHSASMDNATQDGYLANVSFVLSSIFIPHYSIIGNIPVLLLLLIRLFVNGWFLITHQCLYLRGKQV
jgi:hypothetical protein